MNALYSIPYSQPVTVSHPGLLNSPDLWQWLAYGVVAFLALCAMPEGLKTAAIGLYAPVGRFMRLLYVPWLWGGVFTFAVCLWVIAPVLCVPWLACAPMVLIYAQLRRLAFLGFMRPVLT